ncbi:MAG: 50S ribosomal protein L24 [Bacilli bacterium]|jgi:large subunit ribosomal protein L24
MKIKTGDKVIVIAGKDKGNSGKVIKVFKTKQKVLVENINMIKKHLKPDAQNESGSIIDLEAPLHISNVMLIDKKTNKRTRVGYEKDNQGNKIRIAKKSKEKID